MSTLGQAVSRSRIRRDVQLLRTSDPQEWTGLLARLDGATPFHSWEWLEWVAPLVNCRFLPLIVADGAAPVGVVPLLLKQRGPFQTANWVPFPYLGPLVPPALLGATLDALRHRARRERLVNLQIAVHPLALSAIDGCSTYDSFRFASHRDETYLIDLVGRDLEEIRGSLSRATRQKLNRLVKRGGIELRPSTAEEVSELLPQIESESLERQGLESAYTVELGVKLATRPPAIPLRITSAVLGGTTVGVAAALGGAITVGWIGGVLDRYRDTDANIALYWDAIAWAHASGSHHMDLVGVPTPGIGAFKKQFGGTLSLYPVGQRGSRIYRQMMSLDDARRRQRKRPLVLNKGA